MLCCFLLYYYRKEYNDPLQTLRFYAKQRTSNEKVRLGQHEQCRHTFFRSRVSPYLVNAGTSSILVIY